MQPSRSTSPSSDPATSPEPAASPDPAARAAAPAAADLPPDAAVVLIGLARAAIARALHVRDAPAPAPAPPWTREPGASFVTLTLDGRLRGCLGSLAAVRPLGEDVEQNARAAALRDPRFSPLTRAEADVVEIEVSVLSPVTPLPVADRAEAAARLRPGVDGVVLTCGGRRATLLPQVWRALPDPDRFLDALLRKAGLPEGWWRDDVTLGTYTVTELREEAS